MFQQNFKKLPVECDEVVSLLVVNMLLVVSMKNENMYMPH